MNAATASEGRTINQSGLSPLERGVSLVAGGLLAAAMPPMRLRQLAIGASAAYALYRGATGRCPVSQWALGRMNQRRRVLPNQGGAELMELLRPTDQGQHAPALKRTSAEDMAVDEASRESFPASDPPASTGATSAPTVPSPT